MNKKVWLLIVIGLIIVIGISGKVFVDNQKDRKVTREQEVEGDKIEAERMSVLALKNTFADIKSIKFKYTDFNAVTGTYGMEIEMSNLEGKSAEFDYSFSEGITEITSYKVVDEIGVQKEGKTTGKVSVIYSNGSKGEI
ncbi:hypothetical protein JSQ81_05835 [Sporosarcina sp. Marseille-Q4063]|uniref:hypothetical protein n=1 Tax=Sporosarcina sp. Marseille-Q4063 TaxID=2810514 RepID=UPI001BED4F85|nr:hypothetical protein [Sporosarcina sp. Marseille-Q4063]QUW23087.1 hypothetical protein JSQ81_05835 [Sporosarcina sp. Marseille-Q4063]